MPEIPINYLVVLVAAIAGMAIGALWYGPLFGKQWMALMGITPEKIERAKKGMGKRYALAFLGMLVMSYVLAHAIVFASAYMRVSGPSAGASAGFWNWLGFVAPVLLGKVLWEEKSWKLWLLDSAHYLVALVVMGMILAGWM